MGNKNASIEEKHNREEKISIEHIYSPYENNVKLLVMHKNRNDLHNEKLIKDNRVGEKEKILLAIENFLSKEKMDLFMNKLCNDFFCPNCSRLTSGWFCVVCFDFVCNQCSKDIENEKSHTCKVCDLFDQLVKINKK